MKNLVLNIIALTLIFFVGFTAGYFWNDLTGCNKPDTELIALDSNTQERAEKEIAKNSKTSLIEKTYTKEVRPSYSTKEKTSEKFYNETKKKDLIISIAKKGDKVKVYAFNPADSTVTEREFEGVTENFTAVSMPGSVYVTTSRFIFEPWRFGVTHTRSFNEFDKLNKGTYKADWTPKLKIATWLEIDAGIQYKFDGPLNSKNFETLTKITIKP